MPRTGAIPPVVSLFVSIEIFIPSALTDSEAAAAAAAADLEAAAKEEEAAAEALAPRFTRPSIAASSFAGVEGAVVAGDLFFSASEVAAGSGALVSEAAGAAAVVGGALAVDWPWAKTETERAERERRRRSRGGRMVSELRGV